MEKWKDIPNYEGLYQVSNLGNVKSLERKAKHFSGYRVVNEKILKPGKDSTGYLMVALTKNGKLKSFRVHQLVCMAFLGHTPCGHELVVDHKDANKLNNKLSNLQVITHRENISKDIKGGTSRFVGVSKHGKKWVSNISINGKNNYLGSFKCELSAHLAYQNVLSKLSA